MQGGGYVLLVDLGWAKPMAANVVAFLPATALAFAVHYAWTFQSARKPRAAVWRFGVAKLIGLGINSGGVYLVETLLRLGHYYALPFMLLLTPLAVFAISRSWVFQDVRDDGHRVTKTARD